MLDRATYSTATFFPRSGQPEQLKLFLDSDGRYRWYLKGSSDWIDTEICGRSVDEAQANLSECGIDVQID